MLIGGQTLTTQHEMRATPSQPPAQVQPKAPTSLVVLLVFIILQLLLAIAVLVMKIVFGYLGFDGANPLAVDQTNCSSYSSVYKYEAYQKYIMMISLVMMAICILLSIVILIITSKAIHSSKKLPSTSYSQTFISLTISSLYHVIGPKTRALLYILQSICMLNIITVLGYYLTFYIKMKSTGCAWKSDSDTTTRIIVIWAIAAGLFVFGWIAWLIIVCINIQNRSDEVYQQEEKEEKPKYTYNNINTTEMNSVAYDNTRKQFIPPAEEKNNNYRYYEPTKRLEEEKAEPIQKVRTLDSEKQRYVINVPNQNNNERRYYYHSPNTPKNENRESRHDNPVFNKEKKELYGSPYERIENGRYYQGDRDRNRNDVKPQMMPINQSEKDKEYHRSRFNSNPNYNTYDSYDKSSPAKEQDNYLQSLSRYRIEQDDKDYYKPNQSRQILPEKNDSSSKPQFEGGSRPKLHSNYFKDQSSMLNKKKERRGILNDYIRGKYADN